MSDVDLNHMALESVTYDARRDALEEAGEEVLDIAVVEAPERSGDLKRKHELEEVNEDATEIRVEANTDYAAAVHEGAVPHDIPNAFGLGITVEHPGNKPNPWMRRAIDKAATNNGG